MGNLLYILTFSLQIFGYILLAEKIIKLTKANIISRYIGNGNALIMKNGQVTIRKEKYIDLTNITFTIIAGTIFSMLGLFMTLFDFQTDLSILNKIIYSTIIISILFLFFLIIKNMFLKFIINKYASDEEIELKNCDVPDGAIAIEIFEDGG